MFTQQLILFSMLCYGCLANTNSTIIKSTIVSAAENHIPLTENENLTCAELCVINDDAVEQHAERVGFSDEMIIMETSNRDNLLNEWIENRKYSTSLNDEFLQKTSIIFGISRISSEENLNPECFQHMQRISQGVAERDAWAMKVLDSSGSKESGFLWGQNYWFGSKHGCEAVRHPVYLTLSSQYQRDMKMGLINDLAPFPMDYRVIYVRHSSPWQVEIKFMTERIIHIGLCLPSSCDRHEIYNLTQTYFESGYFEDDKIYDIHPEVVNIKELKLNEGFSKKISLKIATVFLLLTFALLLIAFCLRALRNEDKIGIVNTTESDSSDATAGNAKCTEGKSFKRSFLYKFFKCFDVARNANALFSLAQKSATPIPVINGLRSVCCLWILIFHVIWYMYFTVDNKTFLLSYGERVFFQYVSTAPLLVDVFFTISGFLLTYNFLKNERKLTVIRNSSFRKNAEKFGKFCFHRYLRLAPPYFVLMVIVEIFTSYAEDVSIFHIHERNDQTCSKYWWRNVLFIQNLFHQNDLCLNWTWSLACEMQFFIILSALLFFYANNPVKAKVIILSALISSVIWSYGMGYKHQYRLSFDVMYHTGTEIYINPFIRIMPYLVGSISGWFLATNGGNFMLRPLTEKCFWNIAILIFFSCIYSTVKRDMSLFWTISLYVLGRLSFSVAVSWMILGSATGRSVWWSRFLEWSVFQHLNKLSYSIYLLNPFIIAVVFSLASSSTHAEPIMLCVLTAGFVVIVYFSSVVFSLAFEMPYCNISTLMLMRKKTKQT